MSVERAHGSVGKRLLSHCHHSLQKAHNLVRFFQARLLIVCLLSLLRAFDCLLNRRATLKRNFVFCNNHLLGVCFADICFKHDLMLFFVDFKILL